MEIFLIILIFFTSLGFVEVISMIATAVNDARSSQVDRIVTVIYTSDLDDGVEQTVRSCRAFLENLNTKEGRGGKILLVYNGEDQETKKAVLLLAQDYNNVECVEKDQLPALGR